MSFDFAKSAHDHNYETDYIIRSLLDTDQYKPMMLQFIWLRRELRDVPVEFGVINRTHRVKLGGVVDIEEVRRQFNGVLALRWGRKEIDALRNQAFHGVRTVFKPEFLEWLPTMRLGTPSIEQGADGDIDIRFRGTWADTMMWEIYALPILSELRNRAGMRDMDETELDIFFARAKIRLWDKLQLLVGIPGLKVADFSTRRRFSHRWQDHVVRTCQAVLGDAFTGTSNVYLANKYGLEPIGTNAHELPMVMTAMAAAGRLGETGIREAQYQVLEWWAELYGTAARIMLPDTFGTTQFLEGAPDWAMNWTGMRADSKDPRVAGEEYIAALEARGIDPRGKLILFSDGLDVDDIIRLHAQFAGRIQPGYTPQDFHSAADFLDPLKWVHEPRIRVAFGWGTLLGSDLRGCHPRGLDVFDPISLVCKVLRASGRAAVKLSDNYTKATGTPGEIEHYRSIFGTAGVKGAPVLV